MPTYNSKPKAASTRTKYSLSTVAVLPPSEGQAINPFPGQPIIPTVNAVTGGFIDVATLQQWGLSADQVGGPVKVQPAVLGPAPPAVNPVSVTPYSCRWTSPQFFQDYRCTNYWCSAHLTIRQGTGFAYPDTPISLPVMVIYYIIRGSYSDNWVSIPFSDRLATVLGNVNDVIHVMQGYLSITANNEIMLNQSTRVKGSDTVHNGDSLGIMILTTGTPSLDGTRIVGPIGISYTLVT